MLSMQEISDRFEIQDLMVRYCTAVDAHDWDAYEAVFTPDAFIDYSAMGGAAGGVKKVREFLEMAMPTFAGHQHLIANSAIEFDGDTAHARTMCHNPMVIDRGNGVTETFFCGLWYVDTLVRTSQGWRIKNRVEEKSYFHNVPEDFQVPSSDG